MTNKRLAGVFAAAITPLRTDGAPDLDAVGPFLSFLAERGCHGALLLGTTGEGPSFSPSERAGLWRAGLEVRKKHPEFRLFAGTGTPSLSETIDLTKLAFDLGYDAVVTLPPYYFRSVTEDGLFDWFRRLIAAAVPRDGSLLGYHFPSVAGIGFTLKLLRRLKDTFPVQFAGIKDSSHDREFAGALGQQFGPSLAVFSGTDSDLTWALQNHAVGCITAPANLISPALRLVYDTFRSGADPLQAQAIVSEQRHVLEGHPPFPPTIKALLHRVYDMPRWPVRPPLVDIPPADEERLASEFAGITTNRS